MGLRILGDYQRTKISKGLALLYTNRTLSSVAGSLLALFLPVFWYIHFDLSLVVVMLLYVWNFGLQMLMVIPGAKLMNKLGIRKSIILSTPFICAFYATLYFAEINFLWMGMLAYFLLNIYKAMYWIPYHTSFASFSHSGRRGREMALLTLMSDTIQIFVPLVSSFLIVTFGFNYLFILVLIIQMLSIFPLLTLPAVNESFTWSVKRTVKEVFDKKNRTTFWAYFGDGMQSMVGSVIWPIFIWLLFDESYQSVGFITALVILVSMVLRLVVGDLTDKYDQNKILRAGTLLYSIGWLFKIFVVTAFHVFIISAYHNLAAIIMRTPFDASMYDQSADWGHFMDEYTVVREMILNFGRVVALILMIGLAIYLPINYTFIIAAVSSLLMNAMLHQVDYDLEKSE
ncbi:MAG: MFS transporter [Candidatus Komeilibacteria bacterium]